MPANLTILDLPDASRVDYVLKHTADYDDLGPLAYAVDREWATRQRERFPGIHEAFRRCETFSVAVARDAAAAGLDQFLDLGCGLPARSSVHRIARDHITGARVVAVDRSDWVDLHWPRMLTGGDGHPRFLHADLRDTDRVLDHARETLDLSRPVCLTLIDVLHYLSTADARATLTRYYEELPAGSRLVLSQRTLDGARGDHATRITELATAYDALGAPTWLRTREDTAHVLEPWTLQKPGVTSLRHWPLPTWNPVLTDSLGALSWGAVAEKRPS